jgi:rhodanese-related sulfurtransferase
MGFGVARLLDREMVQELVRLGAQLVEVLPAEEYAEDHLPGAVSHPLRQLDEEVDQIDRLRPVIVYCWDAG